MRLSDLKMDSNTNIIMFHEINNTIIKWLKNNSNQFDNTIFTFDDGLYSQYYYFTTLNELFPNIPKYFFISTNIICEELEVQSHTFPRCDLAHKYYRKNKKNKKHYMKQSQILELSNYNNVFIGGHGHSHLSGKLIGYKTAYAQVWLEDYQNMINWFYQVGLPLKTYCTPYNEYNSFLHGIAKNKFPDIEIIGPNRIDILALINQ